METISSTKMPIFFPLVVLLLTFITISIFSFLPVQAVNDNLTIDQKDALPDISVLEDNLFNYNNVSSNLLSSVIVELDDQIYESPRFEMESMSDDEGSGVLPENISSSSFLENKYNFLEDLVGGISEALETTSTDSSIVASDDSSAAIASPSAPPSAAPTQPQCPKDQQLDQLTQQCIPILEKIEGLDAYKVNINTKNNTEVINQTSKTILDEVQDLKNKQGVKNVEINRIFEVQWDDEPLSDSDKEIIASAETEQIIPTGLKRIGGELLFNQLKKEDNSSINVDADIAIMDTGINPHPDLNLLLDKQVSFVASGPEDKCGHGTHVAGIAGAKDNNFGIVGSAPNVRLWNIKVLEAYNDTMLNQVKCKGDTVSILAGLRYIATHDDEIDVVNLSLGGQCDTTIRDFCNSPVLENAINLLSNRGITIVVAAGNSDLDAITFTPARFQSVITVSNLDDTDGKCGGQGSPNTRGTDDHLALNSNYGPVVDISAPGVEVLSTSKDGGYTVKSGTSMASPLVAGAIAYYKSLHPNDSDSDVKGFIQLSGSSMVVKCNGQSQGPMMDDGDKDAFPEPVLYMPDFINS